MRETNTNLKESVILWLENNRNSGEFEGCIEDNMDFNKLSEDEILWYWDNWVQENLEN